MNGGTDWQFSPRRGQTNGATSLMCCGSSLIKERRPQARRLEGVEQSKLDSHFIRLGWVEKRFETSIVVDKTDVTPTHKVDCYKNRVALEVEWNNKDPFYDRDLNNFRLLFDLRAIDVGVIITRCDELQRIFPAGTRP